MIIYEITTKVRSDLIEDYEQYMRRRHIPELLATGYFSGAKFTRSGNRYRIQYETSALDGYLAHDAARLRADFLEHFPKGVEVERETWEIVETWTKV
ncbi:MAG: DUF4286 family protein [Acidobacteria bacterium]|nr:DUF4286 family protein [Acidobacteriota bacterium]